MALRVAIRLRIVPRVRQPGSWIADTRISIEKKFGPRRAGARLVFKPRTGRTPPRALGLDSSLSLPLHTSH
eukprot:4330252-Prymnesium_polylepis.3